MRELDVVERPVLVSRKHVEFALDDTRPGGARERQGLVRRVRIEDDPLVREGDGGETVSDIAGFVPGRN